MSRKLRITATKIELGALKPGDLYSDKGSEYWGMLYNRALIAEPMQVRLDTPLDQDLLDEPVFKLDIELIEEARSRPTMDPMAPPGWRRQ